MRIALEDLYAMHPKLRGHPMDLPRCGGIALQRSGHLPPAAAAVDHDGLVATAELDWSPNDLTVVETLDRHRITEDGAEAVALAYVNQVGAWVVKRRLQRGESADWLLGNEGRWLALEVSGTTNTDQGARLAEKRAQVARCRLPVTRLAVVVAFGEPSISAATA